MGALSNNSYDYCLVNSLVSEIMTFCYFLLLGHQEVGCEDEFYMTICNADSLKLYFASGKSSANKAHFEIEVSA